jgi:LPXTG-motif cell wall-anchored protein
MAGTWQHVATAAAVLLVVLSTATAAGAAVIEPQWNGSYKFGSYADLLCLDESAAGGYIFGGLAYDASDRTALVVKTDSRGTEEWHQVYTGDEVTGIASLSDGYLLAASYSPLFVDGFYPVSNATGSSRLLMTDPEGSVVRETALSDIWVTDLAVSPDGSAAVCGRVWTGTNETDAYIGIFGPDGSEAKSILLEGRTAASVTHVASGGWAVVGSASLDPLVKTDGWMVRLDGAGEELWHSSLPGVDVRDVTVVSDGGYLLAGSRTLQTDNLGEGTFETRAWAGKIDASGEGLWNAEVGGWQVSGAAEPVPGTYILVGQWGDYPMIKVLDADGNTVSEEINQDIGGRFNRVIALPEGGYTASGFLIHETSALGYAAGYAAPQTGSSPSTIFGGIGALVVLAAVAMLLGRRA